MPDFPRVIGDKIPDPLATPLSALVAAYRPCIDLVRKELGAEIEAHKAVEKADPHFGDDIYLLRFIIASYKKGFDKVKKYLRQTMAWRAANADLLASYRAGAAPKGDDKFRPFFVGGTHYRNKDGHFVFLMRSGLEDNDTILEKGRTADELCAYFVELTEPVFAVLDAATRAANKLFVFLTIIDYKHGSMGTMGSGKFRDALTDSTKQSETYYPMAVGTTVIFNMPTILKAIMKMVLFVMPKSMEEKIRICGDDEPAEILAYAERHLGLAATEVPTFLGGKCACPGGCVLGVPNDRTALLTPEEISTRALPSWAEYMSRCGDRPKQ